jgi:hypothetical protein
MRRGAFRDSLVATLLISCGGAPQRLPVDAGDPLLQLSPSEPRRLTRDPDATQEEDPSVLVSRDGTLWVAWYSNRLGRHASGRERKEIFVSRSRDGLSWTTPAQATQSDEWSFYPSLAQDASGAIHLAFMRWHLRPLGCVPGATGASACTGIEKRILHSRSNDGLAWDAGAAEEVTQGPYDEVPTLLRTSDDRLFLYYVSGYRQGNTNKEIYLRVRAGASWDAARPVAGVQSATEHDTYPHAAQTAANSFYLTWTRFDASAGDVLIHASMQTMFATSSDGMTFSTPTLVSRDANMPVVDVFPYLYSNHARSEWSIVWVTPTGTVSLPVTGTYPNDSVRLDLPGYTPRIAPTPTPGVYLAVWVEGTEPTQKVKYRFFSR